MHRLATAKAIPVTLVIGALGAGKTNFLQQLLTAKPKKQSWAVLVNDIGEAQVDGRVLSPLADGFQAIEGNCLCCSGKVESVSAIETLIEDVGGPFERLVIEASGVSDPLNLIELLTDEHFAGQLILERLVTVVNVQTPIRDALKDNTTRRAIACADIIALSHSDVATTNHVADWIKAMQHLSPQKALVCESVELTLASLANMSSQHWNERQSINEEFATDEKLAINEEFGMSRLEQKTNNAHLTRTSRIELFNPHWSRVDQHYDKMTTALWRFALHCEFDYDLLKDQFDNNEFQRVKGILKTNQGWCFINCAREVHTYTLISAQQSAAWSESRLEGISQGQMDWSLVESRLSTCLIPRSAFA